LTVKRKPHHDLAQIKAKFARVEDLEITRTAVNSAYALGYGLQDIVDVIQALDRKDFKSSSPAHSPPVPGIWHDTYNIRWEGYHLYVKFAGKTIVDVSLVSFKEKDA
jgi:motility quorum-sensing regulator/GCU-specific mRNA interferase toxin